MSPAGIGKRSAFHGRCAFFLQSTHHLRRASLDREACDDHAQAEQLWQVLEKLHSIFRGMTPGSSCFCPPLELLVLQSEASGPPRAKARCEWERPPTQFRRPSASHSWRECQGQFTTFLPCHRLMSKPQALDLPYSLSPVTRAQGFWFRFI